MYALDIAATGPNVPTPSNLVEDQSQVDEGGSVALAPPLPGDISVIEIKGEILMVRSGSYLASSEGIELDTRTPLTNGMMLANQLENATLVIVPKPGMRPGRQTAVRAKSGQFHS